MKSEQENFDQLRRLLKLKRYELPPPGYFNNFSSKVIARIEAGPARPDNALDWLYARMPWLESLVAKVARPQVGWGVAITTCALVFSGMVLSESEGLPVVADQFAPATGGVMESPVVATTPAAFGNLGDTATLEGSSNVLGGSLFDQIRTETVPASYQP